MIEFWIGFAAALVVVLLGLGVWTLRIQYRSRRKKDEVAAMEETFESTAHQPLPIDENSPPKFLIFNPQNGYTRNCDCHNKPLTPGDSVLFWPIEGGVVVYCPTGVREYAKE